MDEARQRVEAEINELGTKITNLTNFCILTNISKLIFPYE